MNLLDLYHLIADREEKKQALAHHNFNMAYINGHGYLERRVGKKSVSNWWLIKTRANSDVGMLAVTHICIPKEYVGKRVRVKVQIEVLE
jgi:hypothetical protein